MSRRAFASAACANSPTHPPTYTPTHPSTQAGTHVDSHLAIETTLYAMSTRCPGQNDQWLSNATRLENVRQALACLTLLCAETPTIPEAETQVGLPHLQQLDGFQPQLLLPLSPR